MAPLSFWDPPPFPGEKGRWRRAPPPFGEKQVAGWGGSPRTKPVLQDDLILELLGVFEKRRASERRLLERWVTS